MSRLERLGIDPEWVEPISPTMVEPSQGISPVNRGEAARRLRHQEETWFWLGEYKNDGSASAVAYNINVKSGFGPIEPGWVYAVASGRQVYIKALGQRR